MKKAALLFSLTFVCCLLVFSDDNRKTVAIHPFTGNQDITTVLEDKISNELLKLNRVVLVNRKRQTVETPQQAQAFATANTLGEFGKQMGATHVLNGIVARANIRDRSTDKKQEWDAQITIELSVVDVKTGRILSQSSFSTSQKGKTREEALDNGFKNIVPRTLPFLRNSFPIEGRITQVNKSINSKGITEIDDLLINLGAVHSMKKKMVLDVFEEVTIRDGGENKILENFAGQIRVKEVKGENFSLCTIIGKPREAMQGFFTHPENFIARTPKERVK